MTAHGINKLQFLTIVFMCILTGTEVDLFIPSFPELQAIFNLSPFMVELTLGVNLAAHCVTSLMVGNLGDRYGRKPIILWGLGVFLVGSLFCVFATAYWQLLFGRLLQGVGISGPAVLSYLVIADMYPPKKQQQLMGVLNGTITLAMAVAPLVGSYVSLLFHWRGNFVLLLVLGIICTGLGWALIPPGEKKPDVSLSLTEYKVVLASPKALYFIFCIVLMILGYWIFIGLSPILYMENLGVPLSAFGLYQGSLAAVFALASFSSAYVIKRFGQKACFDFGIWMLRAFLAAASLLIVFKVQNPLAITAVMMMASMGIIFPVNILYPLALAAIPNAKGRISAILVSSRLIFTAIGIQAVSYIYEGSFRYLGLVIILSILGFFWCYARLNREEKIVFQTG